MKPRRRKFNPKRRIAEKIADEVLQVLSERVKYCGSAAHKRNPGDYGLASPSDPRPDKTLCDGAQIHRRADAEALLREGVRKGLISEQKRGEFPQNIWAVSDGIPLEAQLDDPNRGTYHGYPMTKADPFHKIILDRWSS